MKKITTKLSNLHKLFNVIEYEKEFYLDDEIFIETPNGNYQKINAIVKKYTPMVKCVIDGIDKDYICAERHIIMTPNGWCHMKDSIEVSHIDGFSRKVISIMKIGYQDSYDVSMDFPNTYVTNNGLIHHNTFLAMSHALSEVLDPQSDYEKIVIIRSSTPVKDIGALPGTIEEKMAPYEAPYVGICQELFDRKDAYEKLKDFGKISFETTLGLRGITMTNTIVIVDEIQNCMWTEINTIMTRVGKNSKIILCGDGGQNDLNFKKTETSGFRDFMTVASRMQEFRTFRFTSDDIVRSGFVKSWIMTCEHLGL